MDLDRTVNCINSGTQTQKIRPKDASEPVLEWAQIAEDSVAPVRRLPVQPLRSRGSSERSG
jgi:hypothetical protein